MSIQLTPDRYFIGFWHIAIPPEGSRYGKGGNLLMTLWRPLNGPVDKWTLQFRFRYYVDERIFDSQDTTKWMEGEVEGIEEQLKTSLDESQRLAAEAIASRLDYYDLRCDGAAATEKIQASPPPWLHINTFFAA